MLYTTLKRAYYPLPDAGRDSCAAVSSPGVVIIRGNLNNQFAELPPSDCKVVSVISATAPWFLKLSGSDKISFNERRFSYLGDRRWFTEKIRFVLRLAASKGKTFLVLGAIDCTSSCPPSMVAREM